MLFRVLLFGVLAFDWSGQAEPQKTFEDCQRASDVAIKQIEPKPIRITSPRVTRDELRAIAEPICKSIVPVAAYGTR